MFYEDPQKENIQIEYTKETIVSSCKLRIEQIENLIPEIKKADEERKQEHDKKEAEKEAKEAERIRLADEFDKNSNGHWFGAAVKNPHRKDGWEMLMESHRVFDYCYQALPSAECRISELKGMIALVESSSGIVRLPPSEARKIFLEYIP